MPLIADICLFLEEFAPVRLAEDWDNVGLLVGDARQPAERLMTCLALTPASTAEAVHRGAQIVLTHHPLPFKPLRRITTESTPGRLLLDLIRNNIAVYSPHTAFDSAAQGINQQFAEGLGLRNIRPLLPTPTELTGLGAGRFGDLPSPKPLAELAADLKRFLQLERVQHVGDPQAKVQRVAIACGSAGSFLEPAARANCQLLITGETTFHTCLEAQAQDVALLLPGHYASERFAVETLAATLAEKFPTLQTWPSEKETDPLAYL